MRLFKYLLIIVAIFFFIACGSNEEEGSTPSDLHENLSTALYWNDVNWNETNWQ